MRTHYFISGLPRSGSTLLCNILAQNPTFFVSRSTSGCHDVLFNVRNQWDNLIEHQAEGINHDQLRVVLRSIIDSYHITEKNVVIDKGRGWLSLIEMIEFIKNEKCKLIVPVRDLAEVLASFEQLWRRTTSSTQWSFESSNYFRAQTVEGRCEIWSSQEQPVGLAYNRVKDAISRGYRDRMLFVEFDELTLDPKSTLDRIYDFLGEPRFIHNFNNVEQYTKEDDINVHRISDLHTIRPIVAPVPKKAAEILGVALLQKYSNVEVWRQIL